MNQKEQQRVMVLNRIERGEVTGREAAGLMGLSVRQVQRLLAAHRKEGVVALAQGPYAGCNHYHLRGLLAEREGLALSRSTVRRILTAGGAKSPRRPRCSIGAAADLAPKAEPTSSCPRWACGP